MYAIAFATELLFNVNPINCVLNGGKIRNRLRILLRCVSSDRSPFWLDYLCRSIGYLSCLLEGMMQYVCGYSNGQIRMDTRPVSRVILWESRFFKTGQRGSNFNRIDLQKIPHVRESLNFLPIFFS